uniref:Uncharacterized protein n=1 Tax=Melanopsichium pennsylvanicum 4 TaxID=1398559 RepID=A0A077R6A0_9BASI|nr:uncharacterized protein BN887_06166 [Melanopsichium pennsylvanicum 4]
MFCRQRGNDSFLLIFFTRIKLKFQIPSAWPLARLSESDSSTNGLNVPPRYACVSTRGVTFCLLLCRSFQERTIQIKRDVDRFDVESSK